MKQCKAILIDPDATSVTPLLLDDHDNQPLPQLTDLYKLIGTDELSCSTLHNGDTMWFDDNGLLKDWSAQAFCLAPFCATPLAGKIVVVRIEPGVDEDTMLDCRTDIDQLRQAIQWIAPKAVEVPAPTVRTVGEDGRATDPQPLYGSATTWTFADNPGKQE